MDRQAIIVLGPPAADKSTLSEGFARDFGMAIPDPDDAKVVIPEYEDGVGTNTVHEESSIIAKEVAARLVAEGANIVIPTVSDNATKLLSCINGLKKAKYQVHVVVLVVEPNEAFRRMTARFLKTGRLVAVDYAKSIGVKPSEIHIQIRRRR